MQADDVQSRQTAACSGVALVFLEVVLIEICARLFVKIYDILRQKTLPSTKEAYGFLP